MYLRPSRVVCACERGAASRIRASIDMDMDMDMEVVAYAGMRHVM